MLNVKKKKTIKVARLLGIFWIGKLIHFWLSSTRVIIKNYGVSFGVSGWIFIFLSIVLVVFLTKIWWKNSFKGIDLIVAGGWINLIDRINFGYVRDYWQVGRIYNNLADWMIQVGVIIFLSQIWIRKLK